MAVMYMPPTCCGRMKDAQYRDSPSFYMFDVSNMKDGINEEMTEIRNVC